MTSKPTKREASIPAIESAELHQAQVDAFIERNRDALNESIRCGREEFAQGVYETRTMDEIIAEGQSRHCSAS